MRVLIADDQKGVGTTLAELVSKCHHEVVEVVGSGFDAIQAYHRHQPDIVLMDYFMPRLNGATACRNILSRYPEANVILVSGVAGAEDLNHSGAIAVLSKPIDLIRLKNLLSAPSTPDERLPPPRLTDNLFTADYTDQTDGNQNTDDDHKCERRSSSSLNP